MDKSISLSIAIVDDNEDDHFFIKTALDEYRNLRFISFFSGQEIIDYLLGKIHDKGSDKRLPDVVILDINMPKLSGFETFEILNAYDELKNIFFFILSTSIKHDISKCKRLRIKCYQKPFTISQFTEVLEEIIHITNQEKS